MLEPLRSIPGPLFLLLFWAGFLAVHAWMRWCRERQVPERPVSPEDLSAPELALLVGGWRRCLEILVYDLLERGLLKWTDGTHEALVASGKGKTTDALELRLLAEARTPLGPESLVASLQTSVVLAHGLEERRAALGLVRTAAQQRDAWRMGWPVPVVWGGTGLVKLGLGLHHERPVAFLVLSLLAAAVLLLVSHVHWGGAVMTDKAKALLERAKGRYHLKADLVDPASVGGPHRLMAFALFGMAALSPIALADGLVRNWAASPAHAGGGDSSGDGGSFGSDSGGSDSGGGDSGGGGGCGGCGGGGD